jgi:magnesium chelatase subunit I
MDILNVRPVFPFVAIVGQEEIKLSLLLNVIDPKIGGVIVMGDRGTGKSTTVRSLVDLLPTIKMIPDDPFQSHPNNLELISEEIRKRYNAGKKFPAVQRKIPIVDLPLGATEDRVCGTIDIEKALREGIKAFEPGLLARANRGILYVDEVNLLDDHLVDVLLDSAASGWNTVEREGISISHPARFILVGSGNPEEGELRPQLLDRFGMHAKINTTRDPEQRVLIVEQRTKFDLFPTEFRQKYQDAQLALSKRLTHAQQVLNDTELSSTLRFQISQLCAELNTDGLRGDIVSNRAARALSAFEGRSTVTVEDVKRIVVLCLGHRLRTDPLETVESGRKVRELFSSFFENELRILISNNIFELLSYSYK